MLSAHEVYKPQQSLSIASREWWEWLVAMAVFALSLALLAPHISGLGALLMAGLAGWSSWPASDLLRLLFPHHGLYWLARHLATANHYHPVADSQSIPPVVQP